MPTFGGIHIPDELVAAPSVAPPARPEFSDILGAAAEAAFGQLRYGLPLQAKALTYELTPEDEARYRRGLAETGARAARVAPAGVDDVLGGRVGPVRFAAENLVASLPHMAGAAAGALGGLALGGGPGALAGAVAGGIPQFSAANTARAAEEGTFDREAAVRALAVAPVQSAADAAIGRFLPFARAMTPSAGGFLRRTAGSMAGAGATEAVTEPLQQVGERFAAGLALGDRDAAGEYLNAAVTAFAVGGMMGAGGGIRRSNAHRLPADQVTNEDLEEATRLALPAPPDLVAGADGVTRVNPSGTVQLALPSPEMFRAPDVVVDAAGRAQPTDQPLADLAGGTDPAALPAILANTPRPSNVLDLGQPPARNIDEDPAIQAVLQAAALPAPQLPLGSQPSVRALLGVPVGELPEVEIARGRPFAKAPITELQVVLDEAAKGKKLDPALVAEAQREVDLRTGEATGELPLTADNFQQRVDELKRGLRGGFVQNVEAASPEELLDKVYTQVVEGQDDRVNTRKFAQRLGILDPADPFALGPVGKKLEARKAVSAAGGGGGPSIQNSGTDSPAPPAPSTPQPQVGSRPAPENTDPGFEARWKELRPGRVDGVGDTPEERAADRRRELDRLEAVRRASRNEGELRVNVFRELANEQRDGDKGDRGGGPSPMERLARNLGLVTDDAAMDITPLGRATHLSSPEGLEEIVTAAQNQGYAGAAASVFDRGARAHLGGPEETAFTSFEDMAAYEAGKVWAQQYIATPQTATKAQTEGAVARQGARQTGVAVDRRRVEQAPPPPAQIQQQALNRLLDAADLAAVRDSDVATLRRMVRDGATPTEVGQALSRVQGGQTLFAQPAPRPSGFRGEAPLRGQPRFKEMAGPDAAAQKAAQRAESDTAVEAYRLRGLIEFALAEGGVTDVRAQKLHDLLDEGKTAQVARLLKDFDPEAKPRKRLPTPPERVDDLTRSMMGANDAKFEQAIAGKDFFGTLDHMIERAPSRYHREIARSVRKLAERLQKAGVQFSFKLVEPGDTAPARLNNPASGGLTRFEFQPPKVEVFLKSSAMGGQGGANYQKALHEMVHAVTVPTVNGLRTGTVDAASQAGQAARDLLELAGEVITHVTERLEAGTANDFERRLARTNALSRPDEILAWGLTNPGMQRYLASIAYKPKQSVLSRLGELLRKLLGLEARHDTALVELLRVSEQLFTAPDAELRSMIVRYDPDVAEDTAIEAAIFEGGAAARTAAASNEVTQGVVQAAAQAWERIRPENLSVRMRRLYLGGISINQLERQYAGAVPGAGMWKDAHQARVAVRNRIDLLGDEAQQNYERLERENKNAAEWINQAMTTATKHQLDWDKGWDEHTHLHAKTPQDAPRAARLQQLHKQLVELKHKLSRGKGEGIRALSDFRALNEAQNFARMAQRLHSAVALDPELALGIDDSEINPSDVFLRTDGLDTPAKVRDWWADALNRQIAATEAFLREKHGAAARGTADDQLAMREHLAPIDMLVRSTHEAKAAMARAPYFHLGRFGDWFGSALVRKTESGAVDPKALDALAERLEKAGFTDVQIAADTAKPKIYMRFETRDQAEAFAALAQELEQQGLLEQGKSLAGPRTDPRNTGVSDTLSGEVARYLQAIDASPLYAVDESLDEKERGAILARREEAKQIIIDTWLASQPDSSISKVLTKRYTIEGHGKDMIRNWAHRWRVGAISLANDAAAPKFNRAYASMLAQYQDALVVNRRDADDNPVPRGDPDLVNDVMRELRMRDARNPINEIADSFDKLRAVGHAYFLGLSPAYAFVNLTQLGVTALPELAKKHGYVKSFHAMRRAGADAMAIMNAAVAAAQKLDLKRKADLVLTDAVLKQALGNQPQKLEFARHMIASGAIDIGSAARAMAQIAEGRAGSRLDVGLKYASALGLYTEMVSRLTAAMAARELEGGGASAEPYARSVVSNAMFDYQSWNTARYLGKGGLLGPVTPIVAQFMQYSFQVTEKIVSEFVDAVGRQRQGESSADAAQRRQEAQRFLAGHMAAVTALAGTLGAPFATVFAAVTEKLVDALDDDDEPFDATAAYRGFLADVFGEDMGEVLSRGLPRALGFDLSQRTGEQDLLPFSRVISDRRSWKEAVEGYLGRSIGASPNMLLSVADGGSKLAEGDWLGGAIDMLPVAFKSVGKAYQMTSDGYIDTKGNRLPMTPGASDVLWQLLGFSPAEKAEYSEARGDQMARRGEIGRRADALRDRAIRALLAGDQEAARDAIVEAQAFDQDNPAFAVVPSLQGALLRQQQARARAAALQAPVGVSLRDIAGQQLTRYANVDYAR